MHEAGQHPPSGDPSLQPLIRSLLLELSVYAPLVLIYFLVVLRLAGTYLAGLFRQAPVPYAIAAIAAIVGQGVLLEWLTSWLLRQFGLRN